MCDPPEPDSAAGLGLGLDRRTYVRYGRRMRYEVDVTIPEPLDDRTQRFLESACCSANRLIRFEGGTHSISLTVEVAGMCREDAIRSAVREVAMIFPACESEKYGEPRQL